MQKITTNPLNFIALGHRNGVGKSTIGRYLGLYLNSKVIETSTQIKKVVAEILGDQVVSAPDFKDSFLANGKTVRDLMIDVGNLGRSYGGPTNWLMECGAIKEVLLGNKVVVVGIRSKAEVVCVNALGGYPVRIDGDGSLYDAFDDGAENADWRYVLKNPKNELPRIAVNKFLEYHGLA